MPEITPDLSDQSRCVSVHWSLPVQCVLACTHREDWHEAWRPQTGNRIRYRRTMGVFRTEELHDGGWHTLEIPPPGEICGEPHSSKPGVFCQAPRSHTEFSWTHVATVDGCRHTWNTAIPDYAPERVSQDLSRVRLQAKDLMVQIGELQARVDDLTGQVAGRDETIQRVRDRHRLWVLYDEDACTHEDEDHDVFSIAGVGNVCADAHVKSLCRECSTDDGEFQSRHCAEDHAGTTCWPCPTRKAIDGDPADDGSAR